MQTGADIGRHLGEPRRVHVVGNVVHLHPGGDLVGLHSIDEGGVILTFSLCESFDCLNDVKREMRLEPLQWPFRAILHDIVQKPDDAIICAFSHQGNAQRMQDIWGAGLVGLAVMGAVSDLERGFEQSRFLKLSSERRDLGGGLNTQLGTWVQQSVIIHLS